MNADRFRRELQAGELLFREGDPGHEAFAIETGQIEIYTGDSAGRKVLARLGRDDILGEMALVGDQTRTASAIATEATVLVVINHDYVAERLNAADPLLRHLLRITMVRSRESLEWLSLNPGGVAGIVPSKRQNKLDAEPDRDLAFQRLRMEQDLERALEHGEFELHFQPIVRLKDETIAGHEALIRWNRPGVGRVPPVEFIPVAEQSGLIVRLGHWIITQACAALRQLQSAQPADAGSPLFMAINLSIRQFSDPELFPRIEQALRAEGLAPQRLKLEITESLVMSNMDAALALLNRCKGLGTQLAVDDFGTGYSSLSYLHRFPVDTLKLDRSFLNEITTNEPSMKIVRAISGLAADLGMETVAEGVETVEQAQMCRRIGIDYAQGFHYARAASLDGAMALLRDGPGGMRRIA